VKQPVLTIQVDPRLIDAVVDFTTEVADVAYSLRNVGLAEESGRLVAALDRLDCAGGHNNDAT